MVGLLEQAFLVGKDFGALPAFQVAVVHPERVSGVITLGVPFTPPGAFAIQMQLFPKGFYVQRWRVNFLLNLLQLLTSKSQDRQCLSNCKSQGELKQILVALMLRR